MQHASIFKLRTLAVGVAMLGLTTACRSPGLPTQEPGHNAADADAEVPEYTPPKDVLHTSAFEGVKLGGGGHEHMNHGGHKGHGTPAKKAH